MVAYDSIKMSGSMGKGKVYKTSTEMVKNKTKPNKLLLNCLPRGRRAV